MIRCRIFGHQRIARIDGRKRWWVYCRRCGLPLGQGNEPGDTVFTTDDPRLRRRQRR